MSDERANNWDRPTKGRHFERKTRMIMMNRKFEPVSSLLLLLLDNNPSSHNKATPNGTKMGEIRAAIKEGRRKAEQAPDVGFHPLWNHP